SGAAIYTDRKLVPATTAPTTAEPRRYAPRFSLRPKVVQRAPSGLSFEETAFWQPVLTMFNDYMVEAYTRVGYAVSKTSTLFVQHTYRKDSRPPVTVKHEDQLL